MRINYRGLISKALNYTIAPMSSNVVTDYILEALSICDTRSDIEYSEDDSLRYGLSNKDKVQKSTSID